MAQRTRPRGIGRFAALVCMCAAWSCSSRGCGATGSSTTDGAHASGPNRDVSVNAARCRDEIAHASVSTVPGIGAIDVLAPACEGDRALVVWAMRGHTLSRLERPLSTAATFHPATLVSTGADRLGPMGILASRGPIAWRSPTLALDETETDEVWAAWLDAVDGGEPTVQRGSLSMPAGVVGLGTTVALERRADAVEVLTSIAREGENPRVVRFDVPTPSDRARTLDTVPAALIEGELKAYEPEHRVLVAYAVRDDDARELRVGRLDGQRVTAIGSAPLPARSALVVARGVALGDRSLFVFAPFSIARGDAGRCVALDPTTCIDAGDVTILSVGDDGVRTHRVAAHGLPDSLSLDASGRALVLYLSSESREGEQRAVRFDLASGQVTALRLRATGEIPPLDHPAIVRCAGEPWLVAEVLVQSEASGDVRRPRESAVMAFPFECVVSSTATGH